MLLITANIMSKITTNDLNKLYKVLHWASQSQLMTKIILYALPLELGAVTWISSCITAAGFSYSISKFKDVFKYQTWDNIHSK